MTKTEEELRRDGFFVTLEAVQKAGVSNVVQAYNMGREDAEDTGRVRELEAKCAAYKDEVRGLHGRIGRETARNDDRMANIRAIVGNIRELIDNAKKGVGKDTERELLAFFAVLEKEVAR